MFDRTRRMFETHTELTEYTLTDLLICYTHTNVIIDYTHADQIIYYTQI